MFDVGPSVGMRSVVLLAAGLESDATRGLCRPRVALCALLFQGVDTIEQELPHGAGAFARLFQIDSVQRTEAHHARAPVPLVTEEPTDVGRADDL
jgi:hypothetical protein